MDRLGQVRSDVIHGVLEFASVKKWFERLSLDYSLIKNCRKVFDREIECVRYAQEKDVPFVKLLLQLNKYNIVYDMNDLKDLWASLIAYNQTHLLSYLKVSDLAKLKVANAKAILELCTLSFGTLNQVLNTLNDSRLLSCIIREKLGGIAMSSDVNEAFKRWCIKHHPDKGGDPNVFSDVNETYQKWKKEGAI